MKVLSKMQHMCLEMSCLVNKSFLSVDILVRFLLLISLLHTRALAHSRSTAAAAGNETDFHALLAFKSKIFPDAAREALSSWNESLHFCEWQGVKCSHRHRGRVTFINLTSGGLVGSLSPHIGNLSFLRVLLLDNNSFMGEIPTQLGNLSRLQMLNLSLNSFEGKIPANLFRCPELVTLSLDRNKLVGELPKHFNYSMPKLVILFVRDNNLTGGIPPFIGNLTSLERFAAINNPLGGSIPNTLGHLKNLVLLRLGATKISGIIPHSIYNLSSLTVFSVPYNQLWGSLPPSIGFMFPHLHVLQLYRNQFTGSLPLSISNCSQLLQLELQINHFSGKVTTDFRNMKNLAFLALFDNSFGSGEYGELDFLGSMPNSSNLEALELGGNQFKGVLPDFVGNLSSNLIKFTVDENLIYGTIPPAIGNLVSLEVLEISSNQFTGEIPSNLGYLHELHILSLADNKLSGKIPCSIGKLSLLIELHLDENRLEGAIPSSLGNCQNLLWLTLSGNNLTGTIPRQLFTISSLAKSLDLSHNHLSGSLPEEVGNLKHLGEIDISENGLSGVIPSTLKSCSSLENLYLQYNFFQGSIPQSLESLRGIQDFDLSHNNLSGQIPTFLEAFSLKNLNLSFNNFEGELPMKGVFTNASALSVEGNYRLCGGISELHLPHCLTTNRSRNKMSLSYLLAITVSSVLVGVILLSSFVIWRFKKKRKTQPTISLPTESLLKVTYGELLKATDGFSSANLLGFGSFGHVYRGILLDRDAELVVAVKVLNLQTRGATKSFLAECEALRSIRHRNLVRIITCCSSVDFQGKDFKALIYKLMPNGSLEKWLHPSPEESNEQNEFWGLNLLLRINIAIDVADAVEYLHHQCHTPIIHCDLKPSNIFLDHDMIAHVGDFGLARFCTELTIASRSSSTAIRGTIGYAAPEYGLGNEMSTSGDVYSYGILLLEMITGKRPTDKMFEACLNLHNFARMALAEQRVLEIVDPMLLAQVENGSIMVESLLIPMIKIGVACSTESPRDRMSLSKVLHELHLVKNKILQGGMDSEAMVGASGNPITLENPV